MPRFDPQEFPGLYTSGQAAKKVGVNPIIFSWVVYTEKVELVTIGLRKFYNDAAIEKIRKIVRDKDPKRRFICDPKRRNGPQRKTRERLAREKAVRSEGEPVLTGASEAERN